MNHPWWREIFRVVSILLPVVIIGYLIDQVVVSLLVGVILILSWHLWQHYRFEHWLDSGRKKDVPDIDGIWGETYYHVYRLHARQRKLAGRLSDVLGRYKKTAAALPDGTLVLSSDNTIEWMNAAACDMLSLARKDDVGQRIDNLIRYPKFVRFLNAHDYSEPLELKTVEGIRERVLQIHVVPYGKNQRLLVARDITRLHRLEATRRDFVANVSHELRTPLTVVHGYLESMVEQCSENDRLFSPLQQMQAQTERMTHLVDDLLIISRLETEDVVSQQALFDPIPMLKKLQNDAIAISGERDHQIQFNIESDCKIKGREKEIYSVFSNLVRNALQYTDPGKKVAVSWSSGTNGAYFCVKDEGVGIPRQLIPRLTERFFRVDTGRSRDVGGTGLGLAIVKHILTNHDASLSIESDVGKGSTFCCHFPVERISCEN